MLDKPTFSIAQTTTTQQSVKIWKPFSWLWTSAEKKWTELSSSITIFLKERNESFLFQFNVSIKKVFTNIRRRIYVSFRTWLTCACLDTSRRAFWWHSWRGLTSGWERCMFCPCLVERLWEKKFSDHTDRDLWNILTFSITLVDGFVDQIFPFIFVNHRFKECFLQSLKVDSSFGKSDFSVAPDANESAAHVLWSDAFVDAMFGVDVEEMDSWIVATVLHIQSLLVQFNAVIDGTIDDETFVAAAFLTKCQVGKI